MSAATGRVDLRDYLVISLWFGCNNDCILCMLRGFREALPGIGFDRFREVVRDVRDRRRFENLILSGAEVTTFEELERYARFAASLGWFKRIQVQTNGRRLADGDYLRRLIDSGVNEFFVSIQGDEAIHDRITQRPGSYRETMRGLGNLAAYDVNVISNSVLTLVNLDVMETLMAVLSAERISEFHLWNYFPMRNDEGGGLVVDLESVQSLVPRLREMLGPEARPLVLKAFPHCMPAPEGVFFDSHFPVTVLPKAFWREFEESRFGGCPHRNRCVDQSCWGLSAAYLAAYGDERERLCPLRDMTER